MSAAGADGRPTNADGYSRELAGAISAMLDALDGLERHLNAPDVRAAAALLIGRELEHAWLALTAAHGALRRTLPAAVQMSPAARAVVVDHLVPAGVYVVEALASADVLDPTSIDAIAERRPQLVEGRYRVGDETWEFCEILATLVQARDRHRVIEQGARQSGVVEISRRVRVDLESDLAQTAARLRAALFTGEEIRSDGVLYRRTRGREALIGALEHHETAVMTAELHAGNFYDEHVAAVTAQMLRSPDPVPVVVLADDRWMPQLADGRWPPTLYVPRVALFLTQRAGGLALKDRVRGRLNHELARTVIRATQKPPLRRPQVALPYVRQMLRTEDRLAEGIAEYLARRTMQRARAAWHDGAFNPYTAQERRKHPLYGCSFVSAGLRLAVFGNDPPPECAERWTHGTDRLGLMTERLVGETGVRAKSVLSTTIDEVFVAVKALRGSPNAIESGTARMCEEALQRFVEGTERLPLANRQPPDGFRFFPASDVKLVPECDHRSDDVVVETTPGVHLDDKRRCRACG